MSGPAIVPLARTSADKPRDRQPPPIAPVPTQTRRVTGPGRNRVDGLITTAVETAVKAILLKLTELLAEAIVTGGAQVVRVAKIIIEFGGAVKTYDDDDGFLVNIPITHLPGHAFAINVRFHVGAKDPPPGLAAEMAVDFVSENGELDKFNVVEGADAPPANDPSAQEPPETNDLGPVFRHTHQLAVLGPAVRSPSGFRVTYLHQPTQTGWIVLQPPSGPARCEAWFTYKLHPSLTGPAEPGTFCPRCGRSSCLASDVPS